MDCVTRLKLVSRGSESFEGEHAKIGIAKSEPFLRLGKPDSECGNGARTIITPMNVKGKTQILLVWICHHR